MLFCLRWGLLNEYSNLLARILGLLLRDHKNNNTAYPLIPRDPNIARLNFLDLRGVDKMSCTIVRISISPKRYRRERAAPPAIAT